MGRHKERETKRDKRKQKEHDERQAWERQQDEQKRAQGFLPIPYTYLMLVHPGDASCPGEQILFPTATPHESSTALALFKQDPTRCDVCSVPYDAKVITQTIVYERPPPDSS